MSHPFPAQATDARKDAKDEERAEEGYDEQSFVRATTKYWVRNDDLSAVKLAISKHLPVLLQGGKAEGSGKDSQLVNSVYLDSSTLELYHGRLNKLPGAVALRLRWYGTGEPKLVFVERKTHRDGWTGDESVKERFPIAPEDVPKLLRADYKGTEPTKMTYTAKELRLLDEVQQLISTKSLVPTVRSQCHRTAFQLERSNAVRASIDTNLCLISEVQKDEDGDPLDASAKGDARWYRDASKNIPKNEITRFPFAVLELKLAMDASEDLPEWIRPLVASDALAPVNKFSKFIHGCAVLIPDEVQAMPYWIDDPALAASIAATGSGAILNNKSPKTPLAAWTEPSAQWTDPSTLQAARKVPRKATAANNRHRASRSQSDALYAESCFDGYGRDRCYDDASRLCDGAEGCFASNLDVRDGMQQPLPRQRVEPKLFFANERTFVHWLHAAVVLVSFGAAVYGVVDGDAGALLGPAARARAATYAAALSLGASALATYAALTFKWRAKRIASRDPVEWGDPQGPLILGTVVLLFLTSAWVAELRAWLNSES